MHGSGNPGELSNTALFIWLDRRLDTGVGRYWRQRLMLADGDEVLKRSEARIASAPRVCELRFAKYQLAVRGLVSGAS